MDAQNRSFTLSGETNLQQQHLPNRPSNNLACPASVNMGAPPVIPRPPSYQSPSPFTANSMMSPYGMNPYGMNQNFGYGGVYGGGFGNPLLPGTTGTCLPHEVEDVSRSVFETVGSVVQTFGSVSMMLQSTLFALQNSVHAIASVANQLSHARDHIVQLCLSALRIIKFYYRRLLHLFRFDRRNTVERLWEEAAHHSSESAERHRTILFFAVVIGMPYLMWGFIKNILQSNTSSKWKTGMGEHFKAEVKFTYKASQTDELSVTSGETVFVAPKHKQPVIKGWILASNGDKVGLVPANYIQIQGKVDKMSKIHVPNEEKEVLEKGESPDVVKKE